MNNTSNCLCTWTLRASVSLECIKLGFTKTEMQNAGKLLFHLPLVIRKVEVCLSRSSCLLSGLNLSELRNSQFSSSIRKSNIIVLLTHVWMSWDAHLGGMHAGQCLCDTTTWISKRTNVLFTEEQVIFAYVHRLRFIHIILLCLHCKDILRLTKSVSTVGTNFLGDVFPNLNWRLLP